MKLSRRLTPGRPGRYPAGLRLALLGLLLAVAAFAASRYPAVPAEAWPAPHAFRASAEVCGPLLDRRQWTRFEVPAAAGTVTSAEIDRKLAVPADLVCRANQVEPCSDGRFAPGRRLVLPLHDGADAVEAARAAAGAPEPGGAD
ncbi:MAG TPA: hypothetical protein VHQ65_15865 [Thermoanaerobaculia bacterium]|nr:hypothetical protein [Thermoanaerobaculia bacterium]